jgi:hypothetical protein
MLHRLGVDAGLTLGNKKAVDIVVTREGGMSRAVREAFLPIIAITRGDGQGLTGFSATVIAFLLPAFFMFVP